MVACVRERCTVPNVLTASRIVLAFVAAWLAVAGAGGTAVAILIGAALLDAFDGWYARAFAQRSVLGAHLDPLADKILMGVVFTWIGFESRSTWVWILVALVAAREAGVTLLRVYSLRQRGRLIPASRFGRIKMLTQSILGLTLLSVMHFLGYDVPAAIVVLAMGGILIVSYASGMGYVRSWRAFEAQRRSLAGEPPGEAGERRRATAGR